MPAITLVVGTVFVAIAGAFMTRRQPGRTLSRCLFWGGLVIIVMSGVSIALEPASWEVRGRSLPAIAVAPIPNSQQNANMSGTAAAGK